MQQIDCGTAVDSTNVGPGLVRPGDLPSHSLWQPFLVAGTIWIGRKRGLLHALEIGRGKSKLGEDFLVRNRLVVLEPLAGFGDRALFVLANLLIFERGVRQFAG